MISDPQERFLSDNPFRVLCIGSDETFVSVRRKADAAEKAAKVGLLGDIPLADVLGTPSLEELPQVLRGLATDGKRRTCYRIMWPLSTSIIPLLLDGQRLLSSHLPSEELAQLLFLTSWLSYLKSGTPTDAADALRRYKEMYSDGALGGRLIAVLIQEGEPEHDGASNVVADARRTVVQALLRQVSADAAELWNAGRTSGAASLIEVVLNSSIDRDLEDRALEPVVDIAHRLKERVELATSEMEVWHRGSSTEPPNEVIQLADISRSLMGRLPSAKDYQNTAQSWTETLVWRMRRESLRLNHEGDNSGALEVTSAALKLAVTKEQKDRLRKDLAQFKKIVADEMAEEAYSGIEKIDAAPSLGTLNGVGFKLYGYEAFRGDKRFYFTILYFTVVFIPVFPISRYLVKDGEGGGWHFLGKTRWTHWMKIHLGAFCLFLSIFCISIANTPSKSSESKITSVGPSSNSSSSFPSGSPDTLDPRVPSASRGSSTNSGLPVEDEVALSAPEDKTSTEDDSQLAEENERQRKRAELQKELGLIKAEIAALRRDTNGDGGGLDKLRASLENLKEEIDRNEPDPYSQEEIDAHNAKVRRYEDLRSRFNKSVKEYNRKLLQERKKVRRHNEIVDSLNASR